MSEVPEIMIERVENGFVVSTAAAYNAPRGRYIARDAVELGRLVEALAGNPVDASEADARPSRPHAR